MYKEEKMVERVETLKSIETLKRSVFNRIIQNPFTNPALLQLEQCLVSNSYLTLKCKIGFFERCHIQVFSPTEFTKYQFEE